MVPSWAAKDAPVRPAMMMAVMIAPICRAMPTPTRFATKMVAPNMRSCWAPTKARISPTSRLISVTMGSALAPQSCTTSQKSLRR